MVITGAAGRLGKSLTGHLGQNPEYSLVLIDRESRGDPNIRSADLSEFSSDWANLFDGADAVVHLAGNPGRAKTPWAQLNSDNIEITINVFRAAEQYAVRRVVYASTLQIMEGYRFGNGPIAAGAPPRPVVPYAASKLAAESVARYFAEARNVSAICLRIGSVPASGVVPDKEWPAWRLGKWLTEGDLCQAFEKAILAEDIGFAALPLVSKNPDMRWDLTETTRVLGYSPSEMAFRATPTLLNQIRSRIGMLHKRYFDAAWRFYRD